jgi:hypothetical protein
MRESRRIALLALLLLVVAALACNAPGEEPESTSTPTAEMWDDGEVTSSPTPAPPQPTDTPVPDVPGPGCTLNAAFVADVTVPDDTQMSPGQTFNKVWRLRNTGTCDWEAGTVMVFSSGDRLGGPDAVPAGVLAPDDVIDIGVNLTAPDEPGTYRGYWQLETPDGTRFGSSVYVQIIVPEPATATPTQTAMPTETATPTEVACVDPEPIFDPVLTQADAAGVGVGCAIEPSHSIYGAIQDGWTNVDNPNPHTHGHNFMVWQSETREIYVLGSYSEVAGWGILTVYDDTWDESQDVVHPDCADMEVPDGYQLPVRGFGKVWCEYALWDTVGWPDSAEEAVNLLIQPTEYGYLIHVSGGMEERLFALSVDADRWTTAFPLP